VHVEEMGYLARSFYCSNEGKTIAAACEDKVRFLPSLPPSLPSFEKVGEKTDKR